MFNDEVDALVVDNGSGMCKVGEDFIYSVSSNCAFSAELGLPETGRIFTINIFSFLMGGNFRDGEEFKVLFYY